LKFAERGFDGDLVTFNRRVVASAPMIEKRLRAVRRPRCGAILFDETDIKVRGVSKHLQETISICKSDYFQVKQMMRKVGGVRDDPPARQPSSSSYWSRPDFGGDGRSVVACMAHPKPDLAGSASLRILAPGASSFHGLAPFAAARRLESWHCRQGGWQAHYENSADRFIRWRFDRLFPLGVFLAGALAQRVAGHDAMGPIIAAFEPSSVE
jgi:hypothetical protein